MPHAFPVPVALLILALLTAGCDGGPALSPLPADGVILAFGDSLTHGTGAAPGEGYPERLARLSGRRVVNAGVPGEVTAEGLARLPRLLDEVQPDLLLLCHGGNDMLHRHDPAVARSNLEAMVQLARARGVDVVLIGVPRPGVFLGIADMYLELAERLALPIEDAVLADVLGDNRLKSDAIHPNADGYRQVAEALHRLLTKHGAVAND